MTAARSRPTCYCFDTCAFVDAWNRRYPLDLFPSFWQQVDKLACDGIILAPEEVLTELTKVDDGLHEWAKARPHIFRTIDEQVQKKVREIMARFDRLVDTKKGRSIADPWVIAQAQVSGAVVVTDEMPRRPGRSPKIPDVCEALGIPCAKLLDFMRMVGMSFG